MELENLKKYIKSSGIKKEKVANDLGITNVHLSNLLRTGELSNRNGLVLRVRKYLRYKKYWLSGQLMNIGYS